MIRAALNEVVISAHHYPRVALSYFLTALTGSVKTRSEELLLTPATLEASGFPEPNRPMTTARLIGRLN
jgi:indolepyruvate decarboxylase